MSYQWSYEYIKNLVYVEFDITNMNPEDILYDCAMGIYMDSDVGPQAWEGDAVSKDDISSYNTEVEFAYTLENIGRFRINVFRQRNSVALAARVIYDIIPSWEELALPEFLKEYAYSQQGLILIGGPAGHGKTTTLAAIVDYINSTRSANIITIEDPIEYLHSHKKSNVNQREVGVDTESFAIGLKHILRQSPDVIVIGEMRDPESMAIALTAAETGHLVLSTIHSFNAISTVDRIIDMFPSRQHEQIRAQLSEALLLILVQRLVPMASGKGRILAYEKMGQCIGLKKAIREAKTHTLRGQNLGAVDEMISIDVCLSKMVQEGKIKYEDGLKFVDDINTYELLCKKRRKEGL
ncbi:MAG: type IV pili twitching motility protein PilT [Deltaproteobacteria bacterium]|nr:MAG: type IV pili twitching motility protein PilT [Deltaproteobacteria bacterium]